MRELHVLIAVLTAAFAFLRTSQGDEAPVTAAVTNRALTGAELALKKFRVPGGFKVEVFAAEPLLANPVSFTFDEKGRAYVVETHRRRTSVYDIRSHPDWLEADFAFRSVLDRSNFFRKVLIPGNTNLPPKIVHDFNQDGVFDARDLEVESERIQLLEDLNGDGKADRSRTYASDFRTIVSGVAAGIVTRHGKVWFTCIPDLWSLVDTNDNGHADIRQRLLTGFGVHISFGGHDLHGLKFGPDGKLYFSIADRGLQVETEKHVVSNPDSGAIMRCNPDGSEFELVATGLRNPQELAFDQYGNLWTGDNNGDGGDKARLVYVLEGADVGWHIGWQHLPRMGAWNSERLWELPPANTGAYILPPIAHVGHGPAGLAFYPGTGLPSRYANHFFMCDFPGGVNSWAVKPLGAGFEVTDLHEFLGGLYPVDVEFGVEGGVYVADWIEGWDKTEKGRIYHVLDPIVQKDPLIAETKRLLAAGFEQRSAKELVELLEHPDMRIRQEAQFTLAERGASVTNQLAPFLRKNGATIPRLHALWALGQISREDATVLSHVTQVLRDGDPEVRGQAARVLGDRGYAQAGDEILPLLEDGSPRVRMFALMALGKLHHQGSGERIVQAIRENADRDLFVRHAGVMALAWLADLDVLAAATRDMSASVRLAALLAMRHLELPEVASFLYDSEPQLVLEAARAIHDVPLEKAMPQLAGLLQKSAGAGEPVVRRMINASLRAGKFENALLLSEYAADAKNPPGLRADALEALGYWATPPKRDRVIGLWRPIEPHEARGAALVLRSELPKIFQDPSDQVRVAAIQAVTRLKMEESAGAIVQLATNEQVSAVVRAESLKAMERFKDRRLPEALKLAMASKEESLRKQAMLLGGIAPAPSPAARTNAAATPKESGTSAIFRALEQGSIGERQVAFLTLGNLPASTTTPVLTNWLERLRVGGIAPELMLDVLEAAGRSSDPVVKQQLARYREGLPPGDDLASYRETLYGGDAALGKTIFFERIEAACVRCHKIKGEGGEVGPDLAGIGARKDRRYILESMLFPNRQIAPGFESLLITMKDGRSFAGLVKSQDDNQLVLNSPEDGLVTIAKSDIKRRDQGLSPMPAELASVLTKSDLRNLVEFMASLK